MKRVAWVLALLPLTGCDREFSASHAVGPQAARIEGLTWYLVWVCSAVFVVVIGFLLYALYRARRRAETLESGAIDAHILKYVLGAVVVTVVILFSFLVHNLYTGRALAEFAAPDAMSIRVIAHQWWWEVQYQDPNPSRNLTTANEIHIPVGRRVRLELQSQDVIHSFWAPNLHGKADVIPGYSNTTYVRADSAGIYRGRCAEFCGLQHAHMDFLIVAEPPEKFALWYENQLRAAALSPDTLVQRGQNVFLTHGCSLCHGIRGTEADSRVGPDLTHVASRMTIGAGTLPNTRGNLGGWIVNPQSVKPGVRMPPNQLESAELQALLSYMESLK